MVRKQYIYKNGVLVGYQDWHEPHADDPLVVQDFHAKYPPVPPVAVRALAPDEVAFDHFPTVAELAAVFPAKTTT